MPRVPQLLARHLQASGVVPSSAVPSESSASHRHSPQTMDRPESQPLFLPHSLTQEDRDACTGDLGQIEERLRDAQLLASLDQLRVHLHIKSRLVTYKNRHVRHQVPNTRARRRIEVNEGKIIALAEKYRAARKAKLDLAGPGGWEEQWKDLRREDVRTMMAEEDPINMTAEEGVQFISEGRRTTSWIWIMSKGSEVDSTIIPR